MGQGSSKLETIRQEESKREATDQMKGRDGKICEDGMEEGHEG